MRGIVGLLVQPARLAELTGHRIDGPFVVGLDRRILPHPIASIIASATPCSAPSPRARATRLRLPPRAGGDDGDLRQLPLDRRAEPELPAERGQLPPGARHSDERVEGPARLPSAATTSSPRRLTMPSHSCWPSGPSSSRRRFRILAIARTITTCPQDQGDQGQEGRLEATALPAAAADGDGIWDRTIRDPLPRRDTELGEDLDADLVVATSRSRGMNSSRIGAALRWLSTARRNATLIPTNQSTQDAHAAGSGSRSAARWPAPPCAGCRPGRRSGGTATAGRLLRPGRYLTYGR